MCQHVGYGARVPNVFDPQGDAEQDRSPFTWRRARLGRQAGTERLGGSLFELPPGCSTFPLHVHHANEELIVIVAGRPTLRTLDSERILEPGESCRVPGWSSWRPPPRQPLGGPGACVDCEHDVGARTQ